MVLIICSPIQHPEDLEDIAITVIPVKFVARAIEAEHQFAYTSGLCAFLCGGLVIGAAGGGVTVLGLE